MTQVLRGRTAVEGLSPEIIKQVKKIMQRLTYIGNIYPVHTYSHTNHVYAYIYTHVCYSHTYSERKYTKILKLPPDFE